MAQNENISLSLGDRIDVLNKSQSLDARYGVYDSESEALLSMASYGLDGRIVAVYTDKINGKVRLYKYNQVQEQLDPIDEEGLIADNISYDNTDSGLDSDNVQDAIDEVVTMISEAGGGTVTSVGLTVPTGLSVSGSPVTTSGTIGITYTSGYQGYTTTEASKLSGIEAGAQVNVNADWNSNSGDSQILNKPTIPTKTSDLTNDSGFITINEIPVLTNDDNTLIIDEDIIRLNVTNVTEEFTANGTDRNFEMTNVYTSIENVFINGVRIKKSDYITISEQEIEIKTTVTLLSGDEVVIQGTMFIEQ